MTRAWLVVAFAGACALASCGRQGELERPGPIFGPKDAAAYGQQKRDQATAASNASAAGEPGQPPAGSDPYANPAPPAQAPIPGEKTYPSGAPPSGG